MAQAEIYIFQPQKQIALNIVSCCVIAFIYYVFNLIHFNLNLQLFDSGLHLLLSAFVLFSSMSFYFLDSRKDILKIQDYSKFAYASLYLKISLSCLLLSCFFVYTIGVAFKNKNAYLASNLITAILPAAIFFVAYIILFWIKNIKLYFVRELLIAASIVACISISGNEAFLRNKIILPKFYQELILMFNLVFCNLLLFSKFDAQRDLSLMYFSPYHTEKGKKWATVLLITSSLITIIVTFIFSLTKLFALVAIFYFILGVLNKSDLFHKNRFAYKLITDLLLIIPLFNFDI